MDRRLGRIRNDVRFLKRVLIPATLLTLLMLPAASDANETDQFLLPLDRPFVDTGSFVSRAHYFVLHDIVTSTNEKIRKIKKQSDSIERRERLADLHSPLRMANFVRARFGAGFFEPLELEELLRSRHARDVFGPDALTIYKTSKWIYEFVHLPVDPRKIPLSVPSSTMRVFDVYMGTDKLGHFHDLGHLYFKDYTNLVRGGMSPEHAARSVIGNYARGPISEAMTIGLLATGVFSNGDLAANYLGFKFYRNLTEPVILEGKVHAPLLVRVGDYWNLNTHVRADSDFFRAFVSDHLNEALNPSVYEWGAVGPVSAKLRKHSASILAFYADEHGQPRPKSYFQNMAVELSTYYGEDYGHSGFKADMATIAACCYDGK